MSGAPKRTRTTATTSVPGSIDTSRQNTSVRGVDADIRFEMAVSMEGAGRSGRRVVVKKVDRIGRTYVVSKVPMGAVMAMDSGPGESVLSFRCSGFSLPPSWPVRLSRLRPAFPVGVVGRLTYTGIRPLDGTTQSTTQTPWSTASGARPHACARMGSWTREVNCAYSSARCRVVRVSVVFVVDVVSEVEEEEEVDEGAGLFARVLGAGVEVLSVAIETAQGKRSESTPFV